MFMDLCLHLDEAIIPWEPTNQADFVAQACLDSRLQYESLEDLMDFLALLVQTLCPNFRKLIRKISPRFS